MKTNKNEEGQQLQPLSKEATDPQALNNVQDQELVQHKTCEQVNCENCQDINLEDLARGLGIRIVTDTPFPEELNSMLMIGPYTNRPIVVVNQLVSAEEQKTLAMLEIAHYLLGKTLHIRFSNGTGATSDADSSVNEEKHAEELATVLISPQNPILCDLARLSEAIKENGAAFLRSALDKVGVGLHFEQEELQVMQLRLMRMMRSAALDASLS